MESIGQKLKAARERRQISIADVVAATKMTGTYVKAIEADNFGMLVAPIYARGFIKLYAECVGLDPAPLLKQFGAGGRAAPAFAAPPSPARMVQNSSKAPVAQAGKFKPPRLQQSDPLPRHGAPGMSAPISKPLFSWLASLSAGLLSAPNWAFISRVRWARFKLPDRIGRYFPLPVMVWRRIFILAGVALLIIAVVLAWEVSRRGMPSMTNACRWLEEPPAPYLTMKAGAAPSMKTPNTQRPTSNVK